MQCVAEVTENHLRLLASQGIFEENEARCFRNTPTSNFLRTGVPGSVRSLFIFWGSDFYFPCFGQIMHSMNTISLIPSPCASTPVGSILSGVEVEG